MHIDQISTGLKIWESQSIMSIYVSVTGVCFIAPMVLCKDLSLPISHSGSFKQLSVEEKYL